MEKMEKQIRQAAVFAAKAYRMGQEMDGCECYISESRRVICVESENEDVFVRLYEDSFVCNHECVVAFMTDFLQMLCGLTVKKIDENKHIGTYSVSE